MHFERLSGLRQYNSVFSFDISMLVDRPLLMKPKAFIHAFSGGGLPLLMLCGVFLAGTLQLADASEPRIVNIYNFVRNSDSRMPNSEEVLYDATAHQIQLIKKAGLTWRGQHEWDPAANVGFSPGYTPAERRKLVDVYMADFKAIFGYYPRT